MGHLSKNRVRNNILKSGSKNLNIENWKVYHPNGRHMFTCGEKKARWYLDRQLAIETGFREIRFLFSPKGNGFEDNEEFGRSVREVKCVVTGVEDDLQRHHIVPYCYRSFFPENYKSKNHHDVVLMNHEIHSKYEREANKFKNEIAKIYGVKSIPELNDEYTTKLHEIGKEYGILLNAIHSIFKSYGKLPQDVITQKLHFISEKTNIPYEKIEKLNYIQLFAIYLKVKQIHIKHLERFKKENKKFYEHGYLVAQKLNTDEKIRNFILLWRNHFIKTMKPKHMPNGWSVNFRVKTKIA